MTPEFMAVLLGLVTVVAALRFRRDYARLGAVPSSSLYFASAAAIAPITIALCSLLVWKLVIVFASR